MKKLILIILLFMTGSAIAQKVSEEFFEQSGSTVKIYYSLKKEAFVSGVDISLNGGSSWSSIKALSGDIGQLLPAGSYEIVWDALIDFPEGIEGDQIRFRVKASKPAPMRKTFVLLGAAYSIAPQMAFGITVGQVKRVGWYFSAFSNFQYPYYNGHANKEGRALDGTDGYLAFVPGEFQKSYLSLNAGLCVRLGEPLWLRLGAGYGFRRYYQKTVGGDVYCISDNSHEGLSLEGSLDVKFGGFTISAGVHTIFFQFVDSRFGFHYADARIGIGWSF